MERDVLYKLRKTSILVGMALLLNATATPVRGQLWMRIDVDNPAREGSFGNHIEILGNVMLVSWRGDDTLGAYSGAILVYEVSDNGIVFRERLIGSNVEAGDQFGNDFVLAGNELLVEEDQGRDVYNYRYNGTEVLEVGSLPMPDLPGYIYQTLTMALDGDWAFVSVRVQTEPFPRNYYGSTVFVFKRTDDIWVFHSRIDPPGFPDEHPWFGVRMVIQGTHAVIFDASDASAPGTGLGAITFERINDVWEWGPPFPRNGSLTLTSEDEIKTREGNTTYWFRRNGEEWVQDRQLQFVSDDIYTQGWSYTNEFEHLLFLTRELPDPVLDWTYDVDVFRKGLGGIEWVYDSTFRSPEPGETGDVFGSEIALSDKFLIVAASSRDLDLRPDGGDYYDEVGAVYYALRENFVPGVLSTSEIESWPTGVSVSFAYPNPTTGNAIVNYRVTEGERVSISIYDALGRFAAQPLESLQGPGSYSQSLDLRLFPSGIYFYRVSIGNASVTRPLSKIR